MSRNRFSRLNQYRSMWVLVFFDLPTETRAARKAAARFRNDLLDNGFGMFEFSIYILFCHSRENPAVNIKRTQDRLPKKRKVAIMQITDKQLGMIEHLHGKKEVEPEPPAQQLELF